MALVDIVLPTGEQATVPQEDLAQAKVAGAREVTEQDRVQGEIGGLLGQAATAAIGAGRTATMGLSDLALTEGADIAQGLAYDLGVEGELRKRGLSVDRRDMAKVLSLAQETNPYSNMAGEAAGLFLGPVPTAGGAVEAEVGARLGEGLLGKVASLGLRGATEAALMSGQHTASEQILSGNADAGLDGQKIFAAMPKDALIGAVAGAGMGAAGHYIGEAANEIRSAFTKARGPIASTTLDEIAGVAGAGKAVQQDARATEEFIEKLRKTGATKEQAARMADEVNTFTRVRTDAGPISGWVDDLTDFYARNRVGNNAAMKEVVEGEYARRAARLAQNDEILNGQAARMARDGTVAMQKLEGTLDELQFTQKPEQMAKLVDAKLFDTQRDTVAKLLQDADDTLRFWEGTAAKGGSEGAIKNLRKTWTDAMYSMAKVEESGSAMASRDLFIKTDKLKRAIDSVSKYSAKSEFGLPEAVMGVDGGQYGLRPLGDKFRAALEDESVWGRAGAAQREWNGSFSEAFARRTAFEDGLGVSIDRSRGVAIPEVDFAKTRGMLNSLSGGETDAMLQPVKNTEAWISGQRDRLNALEKYAEISEVQKAKIAEGRKALDAFEKTFGEARKEAGIVNRIKQAQLEEQGNAIGGFVGLASDIVTSPMKTIERLAAARAMARKFEKSVAEGLDRFFGEKTQAIADTLRVRPKEDIVKEIGFIRGIANNMPAMQERAARMVGDLVTYSPETAKEVQATAVRAMIFLAQEAPRPLGVTRSITSSKDPEPRYSAQALSEWENKRNAAFEPQGVITDMRHGRLNREAIRTIEFVSPKLFKDLQRQAEDYLDRLKAEGKLDSMPYAKQAAFATLLKVPADGTWEPDFIAMMQASKALALQNKPAPAPGPASQQTSKRAIKLNTKVYATEAQTIEAGGSVL